MTNRVCVLPSVHQTFDYRIFHKQAKSLARAGYDVTIIAQHDKDEVVDRVNIVALGMALQKLPYIPLGYALYGD